MTSARSHELLYAVLRLDRPMQLSLRDLVNCALVSKAFRAAMYAHVTRLDFTAESVRRKVWWWPAKLCSVTEASLHGSALPGVAKLSQLRSLRLTATFHMDLQPLRALQHLTELHVHGKSAAGMEYIPSLVSLALNPRRAADMHALQQQTQLMHLVLHNDGSCSNNKARRLSPRHFQGLQSLSQLQSLSLLTSHLSSMGGASALLPCTALQHLALEYKACGCYDLCDDLNCSSLAPLSQLRAVTLHNMADEFELLALDTHLMPGLERLVLVEPRPFSGEGDGPPHIAVPALEVQFGGQDWASVAEFMADLASVHKEAKYL